VKRIFDDEKRVLLAKTVRFQRKACASSEKHVLPAKNVSIQREACVSGENCVLSAKTVSFPTGNVSFTT